MTYPKTISGVFVEFFGDRSVGIFDQEWEIKGEITFDDKQHEEEFYQKLDTAFSLISDTPISFCSFEERQEMIGQENQYMCACCHKNPVDVDNGFDTCQQCMNAV